MSERFCKYLKRGYCSVKAKIVSSRECDKCRANTISQNNNSNKENQKWK